VNEISDLDLIEHRAICYSIPGDHDTMLREPHVRMLSWQLRRVLHEAEARHRAMGRAAAAS
jgi:hypothetical protein